MIDLNATRGQLSDALHWALEDASDSSMASANWLARDIDQHCDSAVALVTRSSTSLDDLQRAKRVFKTMRIVGETSRDRRTGGRLYLAAIASALVHHDRRISNQSDEALQRGLTQMVADDEAPETLQHLAEQALKKLDAPNAERPAG